MCGEDCSKTLAMSPGGGGGGGGGGAEKEKKVVLDEVDQEELDHTLELRLRSDVMAEKAERESGLKNDDGTSADGSGEEKKDFYCKYCNKKFANSQALGGHQNAHKRERGSTKKEKADEEALAHIESHLYPYSSIASYNRLYGSSSYSKPPLGVQSQSMIGKPFHSWSRGGIGIGYGSYGGVRGGWPRYSLMNPTAGGGQFPIMNRPRQPSLLNSHYATTSSYWGGSGSSVGVGGGGGRCGPQQPPPPPPLPQARHVNIAGYHNQPPPSAVAAAAQTRGHFNLGGTGTTRVRPGPFEGTFLQIGTSNPLDNGIGSSAEFLARQGGGGVAENPRQEVRSGALQKEKEEARDIDLTLRL